jgi:hypothetical protein
LTTVNTGNAVTINAWDGTPHIFDNKYWIGLINGWAVSQPNSPTTNLWTGPPNQNILLNADICLAYNLTIFGTYHLAKPTQHCGPYPNGCRQPDDNSIPITQSLAVTYANSNTAFLAAFAPAFAKLTTLGYGVPSSVDGSTSSGRLGTLTSIDFATC